MRLQCSAVGCVAVAGRRVYKHRCARSLRTVYIYALVRGKVLVERTPALPQARTPALPHSRTPALLNSIRLGRDVIEPDFGRLNSSSCAAGAGSESAGLSKSSAENSSSSLGASRWALASAPLEMSAALPEAALCISCATRRRRDGAFARV